MTPRRESRRVKVDEMCHWGKMMQRSWVDQVKSICEKEVSRWVELGGRRIRHTFMLHLGPWVGISMPPWSMWLWSIVRVRGYNTKNRRKDIKLRQLFDLDKARDVK